MRLELKFTEDMTEEERRLMKEVDLNLRKNVQEELAQCQIFH